MEFWGGGVFWIVVLFVFSNSKFWALEVKSRKDFHGTSEPELPVCSRAFPPQDSPTPVLSQLLRFRPCRWKDPGRGWEAPGSQRPGPLHLWDALRVLIAHIWVVNFIS